MPESDPVVKPTVESPEPLSSSMMEANSRKLSKSSSADSAVEATEESLAVAGEEENKNEEEGNEGERTSCDKEKMGEEERRSFAEIPTH